MTLSNNLFRIILSISFIFISFSLIAEPTLEEVVVSARKVDESVKRMSDGGVRLVRSTAAADVQP